MSKIQVENVDVRSLGSEVDFPPPPPALTLAR